MIKICNECGQNFTPNVHNQVYCCKQCKDKARSRRQNLKRPNNLSVERICIICGEKFLAKSGSQKTCGEDCRNIANQQRNKKHNDKKPRKLKDIIRKCKYCNGSFSPKTKNQIFCCKNCQEIYYGKTNYGSIKGKIYYQNNKEKIQEKHKEYYKNNKEKTLQRGRKNRAIRQTIDPDYVLKKRVREQIRDHLKRNLLNKNFHTFDLLGYTVQDLHFRLESLFEQNSLPNKEKLTWDNMGKIWHIDHIKPCASFKFVNEDGSVNYEVIKECWALDNLQPMYSEDNVSKSSYYDGYYWVKGEPII